jgi:hypothetical protein
VPVRLTQGVSAWKRHWPVTAKKIAPRHDVSMNPRTNATPTYHSLAVESTSWSYKGAKSEIHAGNPCTMATHDYMNMAGR